MKVDKELYKNENIAPYIGMIVTAIANRAVEREKLIQALQTRPGFKPFTTNYKAFAEAMEMMDKLVEAFIQARWDEDRGLAALNITGVEKVTETLGMVDKWGDVFQVFFLPTWLDILEQRDYTLFRPGEEEGFYDFSRRLWQRFVQTLENKMTRFGKNKQSLGLLFEYLDMLKDLVSEKDLKTNIRESRTIPTPEEVREVLSMIASGVLWIVVAFLRLEYWVGLKDVEELETLDTSVDYVDEAMKMLGVSRETFSVEKGFPGEGCFDLVVSSALCYQAVILLLGEEVFDLVYEEMEAELFDDEEEDEWAEEEDDDDIW